MKPVLPDLRNENLKLLTCEYLPHALPVGMFKEYEYRVPRSSRGHFAASSLVTCASFVTFHVTESIFDANLLNIESSL